MTSIEPRSKSVLRECLLATATRVLFGATNMLVGHPFDTVKTKMQVGRGGYAGTSMLQSIRQIFADDGPIVFYRGCIPPLWGSAVYRSAQFAVYDLVYALLQEQPALRETVPGTGMELRVPLAGVAGATARTVLESPIEYAKVKGQTGQAWRICEIYQGAGLQWARTGPMMTFYFFAFDACKRNGCTASPVGQFVSSGGCALLGFWIVWPFEMLKNQTQAGVGGTILDKVRNTPGGVLGLYRGIAPGSISVFLGNGAAMIVMQQANGLITRWGLRS